MEKPIEPTGIDKRTKEYKEYKEKMKLWESRQEKGLGDVVETITKATGIKAFVDLLSDDCGCDERKEQLNDWWRKKFPRKKVVPLEEGDYNYLTNFLESNYKIISPPVQRRLNSIYNKVFPVKREAEKADFTTCTGCLKRRIAELEKLHKGYGI